MLIRSGDVLVTGVLALDPADITAAAQEMRRGCICDFTAFLPLPAGSADSDHGLLWVNHKYTDPQIMFPGLAEEDAPAPATAAARSARRAARARPRQDPRRGGSQARPTGTPARSEGVRDVCPEPPSARASSALDLFVVCSYTPRLDI